MAFKNNLALFLVVLMTVMDGQANALRAEMKRVDSRSLTSSEGLSAAVLRSSARLRKIGTSVKANAAEMDMEAPVNRGNHAGEFLITMAIGTPPRKMVAMLDTGSDLMWTQCQPCNNCYAQPDPIFDPSKSSTYGKIPCNSPHCYALPSKTCPQDCRYVYSYGNASTTTGILSNETLTLWDPSGNPQSIAGITFGCSHDTPGGGIFSEADGVLGLGRGSLSLVSQMGSTVGSRFSYCLTSFMDDSPSVTSPLLFDGAANLRETIGVQSTPMISNVFRSDLNSFYYVSVTSIGVGNRTASIPQGSFDIKEDGSGGFIIDSGSALSYLTPAAFTGVAGAIDSVVDWDRVDGSRYNFSLCYRVPRGNKSFVFPDITFNFQGDAKYVVSQKYNFRVVNESSGVMCMLILEMDETMATKTPSILGNYHQQNYHILYDNSNQMISFVPATCSSLSQPAFGERFTDAQSPKPTDSGGHINAGAMVSFQLILAFVIYISVLGICF